MGQFLQEGKWPSRVTSFKKYSLCVITWPNQKNWFVFNVSCMFCPLETPSPGRGIFFGSRAAPLFNKDNVLLLEDVALPVLHWLYLIGQEWASSWTSWASQTTFEVIQSPRAKMQGPDLNLPPHHLCLWWWNRERNSKLGDGGWHYQRWSVIIYMGWGC